MNSNTVPDGKASTNSIYNGAADYQAYYAFDNNSNTYWLPNDNVKKAYLRYDFTKEVCVNKIEIVCDYGLNPTAIQVLFQASNDGSNWANLTSFGSSAGRTVYTFNNENNYKYYRIYSEGAFAQGAVGYIRVSKLQFYGY